MCISENKKARRHYLKAAYVYALITVFCALFGAVYEYFSHEVYSYHMIYAFAFPLVLGVLPCLTLCCFVGIFPPGRLSENLYNAGVGTLTAGSIIRGVFDIYGTSSPLTVVYYITGICLIIAGIIAYMTEYIKSDY